MTKFAINLLPRKRRVFVAGKLRPRCKPFAPHRGPFHPRPDVTEGCKRNWRDLGLPEWVVEQFPDQADCLNCKSTVAKDDWAGRRFLALAEAYLPKRGAA